MKYRHYTPKDASVLCRGMPKCVTAIILIRSVSAGRKRGVIATDETKDLYQANVVKSIGTREDEEGIARHLFGILREFDEEDVDCIYSEAFDTPKIGQAIMNRLLKAAGHHIIYL